MYCSFCGINGHTRRMCGQFELSIREWEQSLSGPPRSAWSLDPRRIYDTRPHHHVTPMSSPPQTPMSSPPRTPPGSPPPPGYLSSYLSGGSPPRTPINDINVPVTPLSVIRYIEEGYIEEYIEEEYIVNSIIIGNINHIYNDNNATEAEVCLPKEVDKPYDTTTCPICMENLTPVNLMITKCGHQFHTNCMLIYLKHKNDCPMCRNIIY